MISLNVKMVKCKRCGIEDLVWDMEYNTNTGNWRLWNPSTEMPHKCEAVKPPKPEKVVPCPHYQCEKRMPKTKLQEHIKTEHLGFY